MTPDAHEATAAFPPPGSRDAGLSTEMRHRALMALVPDVVWETDAAGRLSYLSPALVEVVGHPPSDLIGRPFAAVFSDCSWDLESLRAAEPPHTLSGILHTVRHRAGGVAYCRVSGRRVFDPDTASVLGTVGVAAFADQADLRRAAARALAETLLHGLLGAALVDAGGHVRQANSRFAQAVTGGAGDHAVTGPATALLGTDLSAGDAADADPIWLRVYPAGGGGRRTALSVLAGPLCGDPPRRLLLTVDEQTRAVIRAVLGPDRGTREAEHLPQRYAETLAEGARDLWAEVGPAFDRRPRSVPPPAGVDGAVDITLAALTPRQRQVLDLLAEGCTNKEIGRRLGIAEATVKTHVRALKDALGFLNRTSAAALAIRAAGMPVPMP